MGTDNFATLITTLVIVIAIFMVLREVMLWYWKINELLHCQKTQIILLRLMAKQAGVSSDDIDRAALSDKDYKKKYADKKVGDMIK